MANLSHINGKAIDDISFWNGKAKSGISNIHGLDLTVTSTITIKFAASTTMITDTDFTKDGYRGIIFTGRQNGDVINVNISHQFSNAVYAEAKVYYRINGGSWVQVHSYSSNGSGTDSIPNIDYNDTVDVRLYVNTTAIGGAGTLSVTLTGGTFVSGGGSISPTTPLSFYVDMLEFEM